MFYENLKNKIKQKSSFLISTIIPSKIPEFSIYDTKDAYLYIYYIKNEIFHITTKIDKEFKNIKIDEIVKFGIHDNSFVFYPATKDSNFFKQNFELDTFRFIEMIVSSNLNFIINKIYNEIEFFKQKVLDYEMIYKLKLKDMIVNLSIEDKSNILDSNDELKWALQKEFNLKIGQIAQTNMLDTPQNIFNIIFPNDIYNSQLPLDNKQIVTIDMINKYINKSNLSPLIEQELEINIANKTFQINYFINSIFLQYSNKKMFVNATITISNINLLGTHNKCIIYSNNDLKAEIKSDAITISSKEDLIIYNIESCFLYEDTDITNKVVLNNLKVQSNIPLKIQIDETFIIKNINLDFLKTAKTKHILNIIYLIGSNTRKLVGSSSYKIDDIL
ncbi:MAG: hypothetical protein K2P17_00995 [Helicobacteraceae bacterium]|nr:hypothetical protein [Helicobacteraceae bacterium]